MPDIRTLFVGSLPPDATSRELRLLFSTCEGYEKSMLVTKDVTSLYGFVSFETCEAAEEAQRYFDGFEYDNGVHLKVIFSKRNTPDWFCEKTEIIHTPKQQKNDTSPRTLYIIGFPKEVTQEYFANFMSANFSGQITGYDFSAKKSAFVGFNDTYAARLAREKLNNYEFNYEGQTATLHCNFANTEFIPRTEQPQLITAPPSLAKPGMLIPGSKTIFVSSTSSLDPEVFEPRIREAFDKKIELLSFGGKDKVSAFVLFSSSEEASLAISELHNSELKGMEGIILKASLARTELVPRK